jgi:hydroxymethylpyrimidine pyrophosphatase-like HAD family hydrolase
MAPFVIALDVDGTLYDGAEVSQVDAAALHRAKAAGHVMIVVTGRRWDSVAEVLGPLLALFDRVVVEEGGALIDVAAGTSHLLAPALDPALVDALRAAGVEPLDVGQIVVGAGVEHLAAMQAVNERFGATRAIVINKQSVALTPPTADKGTGLRAAIADLGVGHLPVIAIGDAANDLPMFAVATFPVALANADEAVRAAGIELTVASVGGGVAEALRRYLPSD